MFKNIITNLGDGFLTLKPEKIHKIHTNIYPESLSGPIYEDFYKHNSILARRFYSCKSEKMRLRHILASLFTNL